MAKNREKADTVDTRKIKFQESWQGFVNHLDQLKPGVYASAPAGLQKFVKEVHRSRDEAKRAELEAYIFEGREWIEQPGTQVEASAEDPAE